VSLQPGSVHVVDADTGRATDLDIPDVQLDTTSAGDGSFATIPPAPGRAPLVVDGTVVFLHGGSAISFDVDTGRFRALGAARRVFPSTTGGRVWLVAFGPPTGTGATVWATTEVDVHTGATTSSITAPDETVAVSTRGLVFQDQTTAGARFVARDPSTRRIALSVAATTTAATALGTRGRLFLYADRECGCVRVLDLRHGTQRTVMVPAQAAAFAPDGRVVAFSAGAVAGTWTLVRLDSLAPTTMPSLGLDGARPVWSPDGRRLFGSSYGGGVHALPAPGGAAERGATADVPGVSGASWLAVVGNR
jgi:hypothetical protein